MRNWDGVDRGRQFLEKMGWGREGVQKIYSNWGGVGRDGVEY